MPGSPLRSLAILALGAAIVLSGCALRLPSRTSDGAGLAGDALRSPWPTAGALTGGTEQDDELGTVAVSQVEPDGTLSPAQSDAAESAWTMFEKVMTPTAATATISEFRSGDDADSDSMAWVARDDDGTHWSLTVNLAYATKQSELLATLVHEYGHVLSLSSSQVPPADPDSCTTMWISEGCEREDSWIWAFQQRFWAGYGGAAPPTDASDAVVERFYEAHEEDFVDEYAATSSLEDWAESFMTFVLEDRPSGDSAVARKLLFFWGEDELTEIRTRIRSEFQLD